MNLIDPLLQRQYPNNALLMTVSSIGVVIPQTEYNGRSCFLLFRLCLFIWITCFLSELFLSSLIWRPSLQLTIFRTRECGLYDRCTEFYF